MEQKPRGHAGRHCGRLLGRTGNNWVRGALDAARTPTELPLVGSYDVGDFLPRKVWSFCSPKALILPLATLLIGVKESSELLVTPLGGLSWIMTHVRSSDLAVASYGASFLDLVIADYISPSRALAYPSVASGLVQALAAAAASKGETIQLLWRVAARFIAARPGYWRDIARSDFLKKHCNVLPKTLARLRLEWCCDCGGTLYKRAGARGMTATIALDVANAAVALCRHPTANVVELARMVGLLLLETSNTMVASVLFEQVDIPAIYARAVASPDAEVKRRAAWNGSQPHLRRGGEPVTSEDMRLILANFPKWNGSTAAMAAKIDALQSSPPGQSLFIKANLRLMIAMVESMIRNGRIWGR
ncbi:hypothetical protein BC828DRAFT_439793 [Blastocladiella britannica]|nr:hypothetical protein BC828DRAFT_439793 [Blastocladiella britannica]